MVFTRIPRSGCGTAEFKLTCPAARDARGDLSLAKERLEIRALRSRLVRRPHDQMRRAAVDRQYRAGGVTRGGAGKVKRRAHDLFGLARALERESLLRALGKILRAGPSLADVGMIRMADQDREHRRLQMRLGAFLLRQGDFRARGPRRRRGPRASRPTRAGAR